MASTHLKGRTLPMHHMHGACSPAEEPLELLKAKWSRAIIKIKDYLCPAHLPCSHLTWYGQESFLGPLLSCPHLHSPLLLHLLVLTPPSTLHNAGVEIHKDLPLPSVGL